MAGRKHRHRLDALNRYPRRIALRDRRRVRLRLTRPGDPEAITALLSRLPRDDLMFTRMYLTQDGLGVEWLADPEDFWTTAVVAQGVGGRIVGFAHLHYNPARRADGVGDIQFVVAPEYRGAGLGSRLASECVWLAEWLGVRELRARVVSAQPDAHAIFQRLGFRPAAMLQDGAVTADGRPRHVLLMSRPVRPADTPTA